MADALKLTKLIGTIRANLSRWDQRTFAGPPVNECGTTHCAAGFQAVEDGCTVEVVGTGPYSYVEFFRGNRGVDCAHEAQESLDLTDAEADAMFYFSEDMKNIDEYESLVMAVANGKLMDWIYETNCQGFDYGIFVSEWEDLVIEHWHAGTK